MKDELAGLSDEQVEAGYEAGIGAVVAAREETAKEVYQERYFPYALERMRRRADACRVLILTVGKQPYSVALSLVLSPAETVYFIHTDDTLAFAEAALSLARFTGDHRVRHVDKADATAVYRHILGAIAKHPGVGPSEIAIDVTSGTKAMSGAASAAAGQLGIRQVYIESSQLRPGFFGREYNHVIEHPLVVLGDPKRQEADRAFDRELFALAANLYGELERAGSPGYSYAARVELAHAYECLNALRFEDARAHLEACVRRLGAAGRANTTAEVLVDQRERLRRQLVAVTLLAGMDLEKRFSFNAHAVNVLMRFLVSMAKRRRETQPEIASLLWYRVLELALQRRLAVNGYDTADLRASNPEDLLERFNRQCAEPSYRLSELPSKLALAQAETLLRAIEDDVASRLSCEIHPGRFKGAINSRNQSLLAHGFTPMKSDLLQRLVEVAQRYAAATAEADGYSLPDPDPDFDFVAMTQT